MQAGTHLRSPSTGTVQSSNMYQVSDDTKKKLYEMFGRTEKMVEDDIETIKNWIGTQPHLPEIMEEVQIRNFLNLNKYSVEKTKQKIDMYYTIRSVVPDMFENNNPKMAHMQEAVEQLHFCTHPVALDGIHRIYYVKPTAAYGLSPEELVKVYFGFLEVRLYEDFMVHDIFVCDMEHLTFADIKKCTPTLISKFFTIYKKMYSMRLAKAYYINSPSFISVLLNILKAILKPKIFNRINAYEDANILKEVFPKEFIPKDYGGDGPSVDEMTETTKKAFSKYQWRFDFLDTMRTNENLRPEKLNNDEILGFHGNFKKIDVD